MRKTVVSALLGLLGGAVANAGVNIESYEHTSSYSFESMSGARVLDSYLPTEDSLLLGAGYSYVRDPLVMENLAGTQRVQVMISEYQSLHLTAGYRFSDVFRLGVDSAAVLTRHVGTGADTSLTDSRLMADYTFFQKKKWALGVQGFLTFPTGKAADFLTDSGVGEELLLSLSKEWSALSLSLNGGYASNSKAQDPGDPRLDYRRRAVTEVGAIHKFSDRWSAIAEFHRQWTLPANSNLNPNEFYLGARDQLTESLALFGGTSTGTFDHTTSDEWRILVGLKWAPAKSAPAQVAKTTEPVCEKAAPPDMRFTIHFENAKFSLDDKREIAEMLKALDTHKDKIDSVDVVGHTSVVGTPPYNLKLSLKRAGAIRSFLVREGEPSELVHAEGEGQTMPLDPRMTEDAHRINRRVEIVIPQKLNGEVCR